MRLFIYPIILHKHVPRRQTIQVRLLYYKHFAWTSSTNTTTLIFVNKIADYDSIPGIDPWKCSGPPSSQTHYTLINPGITPHLP